MTYWNEHSDTHIKIGRTPKYLEFNSIGQNLNSDGYIGDNHKQTDVLFLGTCDIMSIAGPIEDHWGMKVCKTLHPTSDYITLGTTGSGVPTMLRRLSSFIQKYGPPKYLYVMIPRFDGYEFVDEQGSCYNVSSRYSTPYFSKKHNLINQSTLKVWNQQLDTVIKTNNKNNIRYLVEEKFFYLETICKCYNINLKWSFNLTDMSIRVLYNNIDIFSNMSEYMKETFVGLAPVVGLNDYDLSMDINSHNEIYKKFVSPEKFDFIKLSNQATANYNFLNSNKTQDSNQNEYIINTITHDLGVLKFIHYHTDDINVNNFYIHGIDELIKNGTSHNFNQSASNFDGAVVCKLNENIIAGIYYSTPPETNKHNCLTVELTYVLPEFRKKNLFTTLHKMLDEVVNYLNLDGVISYQHVSNEMIKKVNDSVGYKPKYNIYYRSTIRT